MMHSQILYVRRIRSGEYDQHDHLTKFRPKSKLEPKLWLADDWLVDEFGFAQRTSLDDIDNTSICHYSLLMTGF